MNVRRAVLPNDTASILHLVNYIDLTIPLRASDIESAKDQWFVSEDSEGITGCVAARKRRGEIRHVVVHPDYQGRGIGSLLVKNAVKYLKEIECSSIWAQVRLYNRRSMALFERCGFIRSDRPIRSLQSSHVRLYRYSLPEPEKAERGRS